MQPRIYTYKITFEEIPHWYWGAHKEKRFNEIYLGSPVTHRWMWEFYTPQIQILELFPNTDEGWSSALSVESRLIRPDLNHPLCLNQCVGGKMSIESRRKGGASGDRRGKSMGGRKAGKTGAGGRKQVEKGIGIFSPEFRANRQTWESEIDGFQSHAAAVAKHNKARGWDPNARFRVK